AHCRRRPAFGLGERCARRRQCRRWADQPEHGRPRRVADPARDRRGACPADPRLPHRARSVPLGQRVAPGRRHRRREVREAQGQGHGMTADLRLAGVAVGCWLSALTALYLTAWTGWLVAAGGAAVAIALVVASRRVGQANGRANRWTAV